MFDANYMEAGQGCLRRLELLVVGELKKSWRVTAYERFYNYVLVLWTESKLQLPRFVQEAIAHTDATM